MTITASRKPGSIVFTAHPDVLATEPAMVAAVETAIAHISGAGVEIFAIDDQIAAAVGLDVLPPGFEVDLCLALGGDGTILRALRQLGSADVPVFGLNYGVTGFLAAAEPAEMGEALDAALAGGYEVTRLPGLRIAGDPQRRLALNDIAFTRRPDHRVADLAYQLGGKEVGHVRCDGLVAATPTGSTGYNLANGGPILAWGVQGFVVSFIAPHTLTARALVVAPDDVLTVRNEADRDSVVVSRDGEAISELLPGEELDVLFCTSVASLAQLPGENFYLRIREKFGRLAR